MARSIPAGSGHALAGPALEARAGQSVEPV